MVGAEFLRDLEPVGNGVETDHADARLALCHGATIEPEQAEPLHDNASPSAISAASVTEAIVATPQFSGVASSSLNSSGSLRIQVPGRM